ncbi:hypothetical protein P3T24_006532 [Paraburkholderia sp. GAS33]|uniref:hypothetical protein n=1 Tax=Paraburkholderia sp. GAS33 TaxID=3035130 RepID=UPI003D211F58
MQINRNRIRTARVVCAGAVAISMMSGMAHAQVPPVDGMAGYPQLVQLEQQAAALRAKGGPVDPRDQPVPVDGQQLQQQLLLIHEDLQQLIALQTTRAQGQ